MSNAFRELLKKIGSGPHTGEDLTRTEAADAMRMMLLGEATAAQIGAFAIAHRIKRPTGAELAGMLDAYDEIGPKLQAIASPKLPLSFGCPYDGRSRTAPVTLLTILILATAGQPAIVHGGDRMPTKYGIPFIEIWDALGVNWRGLSVPQVQRIFERTGVGFIYIPKHFPEAAALVPYRDEIGKRPPIATLELIWCPYEGNSHAIAGFVHPPTEQKFRDALRLRGQHLFTTVKGLEGSCDLPRERTAIVGCSTPPSNAVVQTEDNLICDRADSFERLLLHARDYGFESENVPLSSTEELIAQMQAILQGKRCPLMETALWNGGFYLWNSGACEDLKAGIAKAEQLLTAGEVAAKLQQLMQATSGEE